MHVQRRENFCWFFLDTDMKWIQVRVPQWLRRILLNFAHAYTCCCLIPNVVEVKPGYSLVVSICCWCARSLFGRRYYWHYWRTISDVIINEDECLTLAVREQIEHNSAINRGCKVKRKEENMFSIYLHWPLNDVQTHINSIPTGYSGISSVSSGSLPVGDVQRFSSHNSHGKLFRTWWTLNAHPIFLLHVQPNSHISP